ncbi:unnamed protein product [Durusdinium trenchii]|uniref:Uncharacterized protein n=1 Tax=Durusdinium trenchii TaxID=1381693 RepID=A0ABP0SVG8_9DINO
MQRLLHPPMQRLPNTHSRPRMIPGTDEPLGPLGGAAQLLRQPRYFLNACGETLAWIDEGKLPEENVEAARAVRDALPLSATAVRAAVPCGAAAGQLCEWVMAIFAYFDAVENWEP